MILAIDPGTTESAFVLWDGSTVIRKGIIPNSELLTTLAEVPPVKLCIEMVASYGMPVGKEVFETVLWIGRFMQRWESLGNEWQLIYRKAVKLHHCGNFKAKDGNVRQALIDKYGPPGTKKAPGITYGISSHLWSAFAIATYATEIEKDEF